ncbi:hypothetical protein BC829DRAFT_485941 [Chytridium lagenaria]|nr:hypothetical protein BC829DRAFT_485941 [Chytridium lagenaria]
MQQSQKSSSQFQQSPPSTHQTSIVGVQNVTISDEFGWLKHTDKDPDVLAYISQENAYTDSVMKPHHQVKQWFLDRLKYWDSSNGQVHQPSDTVPSPSPCQIVSTVNPPSTFWEQGSHLYWIDYTTQDGDDGLTLPVYKRQKISPSTNLCTCNIHSDTNASTHQDTGKVEVVVDFASLVPPHAPTFELGVFEVNPGDDRLVAFSYDMNGSESFALYVIDLLDSSKKPEIVRVANATYYSVRWASEMVDEKAVDGRSTDEMKRRGGGWRKGERDKKKKTVRHWIYFNVVDKTYGVPMIVNRVCVKGCSGGGDVATFPIGLEFQAEHIYAEKDISMTTELDSSTDGKYLFLKIVGQETSENLLLASPDQLYRTPQPLILGRQPGRMYDIVPWNATSFLIRINDASYYNYRVILLPCLLLCLHPSLSQPPSNLDFTDISVNVVIPHSPDIYIEKIEAYSKELGIIVWAWKKAMRVAFIVRRVSSHWTRLEDEQVIKHPQSLLRSLPIHHRRHGI